MIEFQTLGTIDLRDPQRGELHVAARPKLVALLAHLLLLRPKGFCRRDALVALFWPDSRQSRARRALNQALYELRQAVGENVIVSRGSEEVGVDRDRIWCDAEAFEETLDRKDRSAALDLYGGELLAAFALPSCPEFEMWLDARRRDLQESALRAARERARELAAAGNRVEAIYWLRRALAWDPYDERVLGKLIRHLLALGDRTGALREYRTFAHRLREIDVEPAPEIQALVSVLSTNGRNLLGSEPGLRLSHSA